MLKMLHVKNSKQEIQTEYKIFNIEIRKGILRYNFKNPTSA